MSTRSHIGIRNADDSISYIYCHFDAYPGGVGTVLKEYYQDRFKIQSLLNLGDISSLNENVSPEKDQKHTFDDPAPGVTVAYHRDRGENDERTKYAKVTTKMNKFLDQEYAYLFEGTAWRCFHWGEEVVW
mgnify:CR=1 FL=1